MGTSGEEVGSFQRSLRVENFTPKYIYWVLYNQSLVGMLQARSLLWSTNIKTAVSSDRSVP